MRFTRTLLAVAALVATGAASAATTLITETGASPLPQVTSVVTYNGGLTTSNTSALEYFVTSTDPAGSFAAFCLEPFQHLTSPWVYENNGTFTTAQADALSMLFTGANWKSWDYLNDGVVTPAQEAGVALAVRDIMLDGSFDLSGGNFMVLDDGFGGAAMSFANSAYAAGNTSMVPNLIRLTDPEKQDLVIAVPEPTTYALMLGGLLGVGFMARRRRQG